MKITLITGTRKGIGRYLAEHYLHAGHLVIGCSRKGTDLSHPNYRHFLLDIANASSVREMFTAVRKEFGQIDHLINNVAAAGLNHSLLTPLEQVEEISETNFVGTFHVCQEAARLMTKKKFGRIVNFTSFTVPLNLEGHAAYVASKAAIEAFSRIMAKEWGVYGITVNCVGPSGTDTDLMKTVPQASRDTLVARQAIKRETKMEDIKNVTDFFLQEESGFITGQTLYLGGP